MNIPQVNANVTDVEREKTKRVCELLGWRIEIAGEDFGVAVNPKWTGREKFGKGAELFHRSLTLDQTVGMLQSDAKFLGDINEDNCELPNGWYVYTTAMEENKHEVTFIGKNLSQTDDPHDLTAALDALIKVLEEKK